MDVFKESLEFHRKSKGKIAIDSKVSIDSKEDLSLAYTPGVAEPCKEIHRDEDLVYDYTSKGNMVAIVTDGSAVLGLGDIGAKAALPVMEGKAVLFKRFGDVDAFPICIESNDTEEIIKTIKNIEPVFGGINLEDISAPRCFEIEARLIDELKIPVFHDDQHGTAIVALAALINAVKITSKELSELKIIVNGAGAAGIAITRLLLKSGVEDIILCDRTGAIYKGRENLNKNKQEIAEITNINYKKGQLGEIIKNADVFIGVSSANVLTFDMVKKMNKDSIIFAMANPTPEIMPDEAIKAGARVVGTGRSDFSNQINNVLAFPGIFRGALDVRARYINDDMKLAAAKAIAGIISEDELKEENIIPKPFDTRVKDAVAAAVAEAAYKSGAARL